MASTFSVKEPSEAYFISFDFSAVVGVETISSAVVTATDQATLAVVSTTILGVESQSITTPYVYARVRAGTSGHTYLINCKIVCSAGSLYELDGILPVEETTVGSTVQSIYDVLQYHPDLQVRSDDLIHVVNMAIRSIAKRLYVLGSDIITGTMSVPIDVSVEDAFGDLPADFWGLAGDPYVSGETYPLSPLPPNEALSYASPGTVVYYEVRGRRIYVTPEAAADCTIMAKYFQKPPVLTGVASIIPFNELFDDLIAEYVEMYFRGAQSKSGNTIQILDKLIKEGVDLVAARYDRKGPVDITQSTVWE